VDASHRHASGAPDAQAKPPDCVQPADLHEMQQSQTPEKRLTCRNRPATGSLALVALWLDGARGLHKDGRYGAGQNARHSPAQRAQAVQRRIRRSAEPCYGHRD
jgi:hypothetical protein